MVVVVVMVMMVVLVAEDLRGEVVAVSVCQQQLWLSDGINGSNGSSPY
jgi:hypothetical protein